MWQYCGVLTLLVACLAPTTQGQEGTCDGYPCPSYTVANKTKCWEYRCYEGNFTEVYTACQGRHCHSRDLYLPLREYVNGRNADKRNLTATLPVYKLYVHHRHVLTSFWIDPRDVALGLPKPDNKHVKFLTTSSPCWWARPLHPKGEVSDKSIPESCVAETLRAKIRTQLCYHSESQLCRGRHKYALVEGVFRTKREIYLIRLA